LHSILKSTTFNCKDEEIFMSDRAPIFERASPEVTEAAKKVITRQMAECLARDCFDLSNDRAVIEILVEAFGSAAAVELGEAARKLALAVPRSGNLH